ncbi:Serine hydroxymethyltransferase [Streptomyces badius]
MTTRSTIGTTPTAPRHPALIASDPELAALIGAEERLQADTLRLIPSENYVSAAVLEASGTVLQNKYSEGYPGKRYYEGQQVIDQVETLAIRRAQALFGMDHANVQPYSGSPANLAAYLAFLQPGDTVLGMSLPMGGHLTHGWDVSATGRWFRGVRYGVRRDTGLIDLDEVRDLALAERPRLIFCGGTAVPRTIDFAGFAEIARETGAVLVADIAHIAGLIAGGAHPSPAGHADVVSTTTHKTLRGPRGAMLLSTAEHARAIDRAVFPGLQGGPHNQTTAAIAVALGEAATAGFCSYAHQVVANARALGRSWRPAASTWSPAAPTTTCCSSTSPTRTSPARPRPRPSTARASSSTTTPSPTTPASPSTPPASGSAPRPRPPGASRPPRWARSPPGSPRRWKRHARATRTRSGRYGAR